MLSPQNLNLLFVYKILIKAILKYTFIYGTSRIKYLIMQKILTIAIDTTQLIKGSLTPFAVNELEEINEILELGWQIEEWDFLKEGETDGQVVLLVILNDDLTIENDHDEFDTEFNEEDDDEYYNEIKEKKD